MVSRAELLAAGLGQGGIEHRVRCGRLHLVHRGVYAVGHSKLTRLGAWRAAVLAGGPGAVLSHRSAAVLWELARGGAGRISVTVPTASGRRRRQGIRIHRAATLAAEETTARDGIPVTTVARTLLDFAATNRSEDLARAVNEAERQRRLDLTDIQAVLHRHPANPGPLASPQWSSSGIPLKP